MQKITLKLPNGCIVAFEGEILKVREMRQGHPYLDESGALKLSPWDPVTKRYWEALRELRRFQQMGELPVEGKLQWHIGWNGALCFSDITDGKCYALTAFFPTYEAAQQALKDFGGWEHLRRVRLDIHMVRGE